MSIRQQISKCVLENLPFTKDVISYVPIPMAYAGPLLLDGVCCHVPMATTEVTLVTRTSKGCLATNKAGGIKSTILVGAGKACYPVVRLPSAKQAFFCQRVALH